MEFTLNRHFIKFNEDLLEILHSFNETRVKDRDGLKEYLNCDRVLRKDGRLLFCRTVDLATLVYEPEVVAVLEEPTEEPAIDTPETDLKE
jgi:hypothetical protein